VVLNQSDLLEPGSRDACRVDLERLLRADGLDDVPVFTISARTGHGLGDLRRVLQRRVAAHIAAIDRLAADVTATAGVLAAGCSDGAAHGIRRTDRERLVESLAEAAGVPAVTRAVALSHRRRGSLAAGWPFLRWVRRLRPDPLRRLRLGPQPDPDSRTSLPGPTPLQSAQVAAAARSLAHGAAAGLCAPWPSLVRSAATRSEDQLTDRLDRAVAAADLEPGRPRWWRMMGLVQAILATVALAGGVWLLVLAALGFLRLPDVLPLPKVDGIPLPTLLLGGGLLAGLLLAALAGAFNRIGARRRARAAAASLGGRVEEVATQLVIQPVEAELAAHDRLCAATREALAVNGRLRALGRRGRVRAGRGA
jgi:hypothetical protein